MHTQIFMKKSTRFSQEMFVFIRWFQFVLNLCFVLWSPTHTHFLSTTPPYQFITPSLTPDTSYHITMLLRTKSLIENSIKTCDMRDNEGLRLFTSLCAFTNPHWRNQLNLILNLKRVDIAFLFIGRVLHVEVSSHLTPSPIKLMNMWQNVQRQP